MCTKKLPCWSNGDLYPIYMLPCSYRTTAKEARRRWTRLCKVTGKHEALKETKSFLYRFLCKGNPLCYWLQGGQHRPLPTWNNLQEQRSEKEQLYSWSNRGETESETQRTTRGWRTSSVIPSDHRRFIKRQWWKTIKKHWRKDCRDSITLCTKWEMGGNANNNKKKLKSCAE